MRIILLLSFFFVFTRLDSQEVKSPSGQVTLTFQLIESVPTYRLNYKDKEVIRTSRLGFELMDKGSAKNSFADEVIKDNSSDNRLDNLKDGFEVVGTTTSSFDETWQPVWGEERNIRFHRRMMW